MKKNLSEIIAIILFFVCTIGVVFGIQFYKNKQMSGKIELLARAPEKGNFYPREITVKKGTDVTLVIRNVDTVSHGFYLPDFFVDEGEIKAGVVKEIKFKADKSGKFPFYCAIWCGDYHMQMKGTIIVK
ncbi:MAG: cupredoxin domain-containing protein [bacterium]|nr:cupredoxin domain-containing protein [bacterium]